MNLVKAFSDKHNCGGFVIAAVRSVVANSSDNKGFCKKKILNDPFQGFTSGQDGEYDLDNE